MQSRPSRTAFSLVELLVIISIIAVLLATLLPALEHATELARRAKCAANQHAIGLGSNTYAYNNRGDYIICRQRLVTMYLSPASGQTGADKDVDWFKGL